MSSVSNGLYFLTLPLVSVMRIIYRKTRQARYLYIKRNVEKLLGTRYLSKNAVLPDLRSLALLKERTCHCCVPGKGVIVTSRRGG